MSRLGVTVSVDRSSVNSIQELAGIDALLDL